MAKSTEVASRGVDSAGSGFADPADVVKRLARARGEGTRGDDMVCSSLAACIVVLTGVSDYISDGNIVLKASNGHELVSDGSTVLMLMAAGGDHRLGMHDGNTDCDVLCLGPDPSSSDAAGV